MRSLKEQEDFQPYSWIDYFLLGNLYIVGFGLDPGELDLWWLIKCKARNFDDQGRIYWYEPSINENGNFAKKELANIYHIKIEREKPPNEEYINYYRWTAEDIGGKLDG